jgi:hypothetical protein
VLPEVGRLVGSIVSRKIIVGGGDGKAVTTTASVGGGVTNGSSPTVGISVEISVGDGVTGDGVTTTSAATGLGVRGVGHPIVSTDGARETDSKSG